MEAAAAIAAAVRLHVSLHVVRAPHLSPGRWWGGHSRGPGGGWGRGGGGGGGPLMKDGEMRGKQDTTYSKSKDSQETETAL